MSWCDFVCTMMRNRKVSWQKFSTVETALSKRDLAV
jgi:hypothetical protein